MRNFFKGISVSQIAAGALAAMTSFWLSAKIGIAGSIIGVAIGSIVSAIASQIYQNVIKVSSEKIPLPALSLDDGDKDQSEAEAQTGVIKSNENPAAGTGEDESTRVISSLGADGLGIGQIAGLAADQTSVLPKARDATALGGPNITAGDETRVLGSPAGMAAHPRQVSSGPGGTSVRVASPADGRTLGSHQAGHAASKLTPKGKKRLAIVVAVVSSLLAVLITAGVISLVTRGQGTDTVVRDLVDNSRVGTQSPEQEQDTGGKQAPSTGGSDGQTPNPNQSGKDSSGSSEPGKGSNGSTDNGQGSQGSTGGGNADKSTGSTGGRGGSGSQGSGSTGNDSGSSSGTGSGSGSSSTGGDAGTQPGSGPGSTGTAGGTGSKHTDGKNGSGSSTGGPGTTGGNSPGGGQTSGSGN
ncbi:hypothetical protein CRD60_02660 [Bifidobacterium aemilianum]|uniref:Uncharacterized protein n=1 Tax=Bifidobacterium aemilianum TaxID=2493120 RepID=A0A366K9T8_9BIFI|nr:hypothetical protein [Bifidobacterium aemilianum]RBP98087.1 hypothetical protein CRD60_02660 [Bifidobacterium aemilianum]